MSWTCDAAGDTCTDAGFDYRCCAQPQLDAALVWVEQLTGREFICIAQRCVALRCAALRCIAQRSVALRSAALRCVAQRCAV
jgi:hypothetical protein